MKPEDILTQVYQGHEQTLAVLLEHSRLVADKAVRIAQKVLHLKPDFDFIHEAAMLHDIGIYLTNSPQLGCYGNRPYVCHGILGRDILERYGLMRHGLVCERHVGVGLTRQDIEKNRLPLPLRDMLPISIDEKIICYADKFYSKTAVCQKQAKTVEQVKLELEPYGSDKVDRFSVWADLFDG